MCLILADVENLYLHSNQVTVLCEAPFDILPERVLQLRWPSGMERLSLEL